MALLIEKAFQNGRKVLEEQGVRVESLATSRTCQTVALKSKTNRFIRVEILPFVSRSFPILHRLLRANVITRQQEVQFFPQTGLPF